MKLALASCRRVVSTSTDFANEWDDDDDRRTTKKSTGIASYLVSKCIWGYLRQFDDTVDNNDSLKPAKLTKVLF
jgi:hypothetical protein